MDSKRRFIVVKGGYKPTVGSECGSGSVSLILMVVSIIGIVISAVFFIIGTESLEAASPVVAASEPASPPVKTFHEQFPVQAGETTIDPPPTF